MRKRCKMSCCSLVVQVLRRRVRGVRPSSSCGLSCSFPSSACNMGWFLRSRLVTHLSVLVGFLFATLSTFYYAWSISRSWPSPTNFTKVIRVFAMIFHALFAAQSVLTWHSLFVASRSISSGLWITFGIASIVFDSWWFTLMASRHGFGGLWCVGSLAGLAALENDRSFGAQRRRRRFLLEERHLNRFLRFPRLLRPLPPHHHAFRLPLQRPLQRNRRPSRPCACPATDDGRLSVRSAGGGQVAVAGEAVDACSVWRRWRVEWEVERAKRASRRSRRHGKHPAHFGLASRRLAPCALRHATSRTRRSIRCRRGPGTEAQLEFVGEFGGRRAGGVGWRGAAAV
ncbi:hypothetical protein BJY59DRAFT_705185 [Rhodotorula toruloides]